MPLAGGCSYAEAMKKGVTVDQPHFCLYMATMDGKPAWRFVMIPRLMEQLAKLGPSDCISTAFHATAPAIKETIIEQRLFVEPQIPVVQHALDKKVCIGKFLPLHSEVDAMLKLIL